MRTGDDVTLLDQVRRLADTRGDRLAVVGSSESWTYREFLDLSHGVAGGVPQDDGPVAIAMGNEPSFVAGMYGAWAAGKAALLIDSRAALPEIQEMIGPLAPAVVVVGKSTPSAVCTAVSDLAPLLTVDSQDLDGSGTLPVVDVDPKSPALMLFTAGSTGEAKAVVHSHLGLSRAAGTVAQQRKSLMRDLTLSRTVEVLRRFPGLPRRLLRAARQLVWMTPMTLSSISGVTIAAQALSSGGRLVTSWPFSPSSTWDVIRDQQVNVLAVTPAMLAALLEERHPGAEASLVVVGVGAGPVPLGLCSRAEAELGCPVIVGYGTTELGGGVLATKPWDRHVDQGDVGCAVAGTEWRIVDGAGHTVPPGVIGELAHRSPGLMVGYAGDAPQAGIDPDGWYLTGDLAVSDPDGRVRMRGRRDQRIERRGNKVYPMQIERVLERHPGVAECAVVGQVADNGETRIDAFIVPLESSFLTARSLDEWCSGQLSKFMVPDRYVMVAELPQTDAAETRRAALMRGEPGLGWIVLDADP